jgi:hypothetical protein
VILARKVHVMATQSKRGPVVEPAGVSELDATQLVVGPAPASADDQSTVE